MITLKRILTTFTLTAAMLPLLHAQAPTVTTNPRYARGATMAFARIQSAIAATGTTISEKGICWSEHPMPTIDDATTKTQLPQLPANDKGLYDLKDGIYWLKDLTPATKYYMRAYAKDSNGSVGYGDEIKFYTLPMGTIKLQMRNGGDEATYNRIKQASEKAVEYWNNLTEIKGFSPSVGFVNGVPTADCSYGGWIQVGSNTSYQRIGTILHEMLHGVGVIPWADTEWSRHTLRSGVNGDGYGTGQWLGERVTELLRFLANNSTATLSGDYQHLWPFGINGAHEDNGQESLYIANGLVCQALGEDGLQHTSKSFAEPYYAFNHDDDTKYYLKSESDECGLYTSYLGTNESGMLKNIAISAEDAKMNDSLAWYITFTPDNQYYQFRNVATGRYLSYSSLYRTVEKTEPSFSEDFHVMKGRVDVSLGNEMKRGYWIIHPEENWTPKCMTANSNGGASGKAFDITDAAKAQRWLILKANELNAIESSALSQLKQQISTALEQVKPLAAVPHEELKAGTDESFISTLNQIDSTLENSVNITELSTLTADAKQAAYQFLCNVTPTDASKPFVLTHMITNGNFDTSDGWSVVPAISNSCAEFYQKTFDMNQTLKQMPAGNYVVKVQGFNRPGASDIAYSDYVAGSNNVSVVFYAGSQFQKIAHIASDAQDTRITTSDTQVSGKYMPNTMSSASAYFAKGLYDNRIITSVANNGKDLKFGLRTTSMPEKYWCCFDNFRLYFYGKMDEETISTDIKPQTTTNHQSYNVYTIDGRLILRNTQQLNHLPRGLYIINGRKVVINK